MIRILIGGPQPLLAVKAGHHHPPANPTMHSGSDKKVLEPLPVSHRTADNIPVSQENTNAILSV